MFRDIISSGGGEKDEKVSPWEISVPFKAVLWRHWYDQGHHGREKMREILPFGDRHRRASRNGCGAGQHHLHPSRQKTLQIGQGRGFPRENHRLKVRRYPGNEISFPRWGAERQGLRGKHQRLPRRGRLLHFHHREQFLSSVRRARHQADRQIHRNQDVDSDVRRIPWDEKISR